MLALIEAWGDNGVALGTFTDVGAYPPKPPPLVELQRNPSGLRFFFLKKRRFHNFLACRRAGTIECRFCYLILSGLSVGWQLGILHPIIICKIRC
jgi:hypothetical protein